MILFTTLRWQQRLVNLQKAFAIFSRSVSQKSYNELEKSGLTHQFKLCFELSWKTLKDYLANEGILADTPRDVIKEAFAVNLLRDARTWIDALEKRNLLSHVYDNETSLLAINLIKETYFPAINHLINFLNTKAFASNYGLDLGTCLTLLEPLIKYPQIEEIILFGSRAMGNFKETSDSDLCIKGSLSENDFAKINTILREGKLPYKVDLLLYSDIKNPELLKHIEDFGKRIYP